MGSIQAYYRYGGVRIAGHRGCEDVGCVGIRVILSAGSQALR